MDAEGMKRSAQWFYSMIYKDEAIRPRVFEPEERLPSMLRTARSLENAPGKSWQTREAIFLKQAKLLVNYEDDYDFRENTVRYYPTYQALTDRELRGYFSWRTQVRRGNLQKTSLTFAYLYIYELLNRVGTADPTDGYWKLKHFRDAYSKLDDSILSYLDRWLADYVVYYGLDASLLADTRQALFARCVTVLDNVAHEEREKVILAVKQLSPKWLERSKFYADYGRDMDEVILRVLRKVSIHYASGCKRSFAEQYFGVCQQFQVRLFDGAVFCDPLKIRACEYAVDERCVYRCSGGLWTVTKHPYQSLSNGKLEQLLKAVDCVMRQEYGYGRPIKCALETKWLLKLIREEAQTLLAEKKAAQAKKITIDYSVLDRIRADAAITRDKLTVEEEFEESEPEQKLPQPMEIAAEIPAESTALGTAEYRLLQCLLYGGSTEWVQREGYMLSVLADSINETLYDTFLDSVLEDGARLVEDYIDDLKEMVHP